MKKKLSYILLFALMAFSVNSCSTFLEIEPEGEIPADEALQSPEDVQQLLVSCYDVLRSNKFMGGRVQFLSELMGDNLDGRDLGGNWLSYYQRNTTIFNQETRDLWSEPYIMVYRCNVLLENMEIVPGLTEDMKVRITAEAKFLRAIGHFELVRMFAQPYGSTADNSHAGIPLRLQASQEVLPRATVGEVYDAILTDMQEAEANMPATNGGYATSWAVKGYMAKVYFQMNDFANAYDKADEVISMGPFSLEPDVMARFSQTANTENVFTLISTGTLDNAGSYLQGVFRSDGSNPPAGHLTSNLYGIATLETTDTRGQNWYIITNEGEPTELVFSARFNDIDWFNMPIVHLGQLHLIRGEAAAQNDDLTTAEADLNGIRVRANLDPLIGLGKAAMIQALRDERRLELVGEGNRLQELKRQGALGEAVTINGAPWDCNGLAVQLPDEEASGNPNIELNPEGGCN